MRLFDMSLVLLRLDELAAALGRGWLQPVEDEARYGGGAPTPPCCGPLPLPAGPESTRYYIEWAMAIGNRLTRSRGKVVASYLFQQPG